MWDQNTSGRAGSCAGRKKSYSSVHVVSQPKGRKDAETHHLNPVPIWVQNESDLFHLSVREALFKWNAEPLEACASGRNVVHGDRNVTESFRVRIARVVRRCLKRLRAVVMGKLENA